MKKILAFVVILLNLILINGVNADEIVPNENEYKGTGTATGGTASTCESYTVGRRITGVKVTLYNSSNIELQTQYFKIKSISENPSIYEENPTIYENDSLCPATYKKDGKTYCKQLIYTLDLTDNVFNSLKDETGARWATFDKFVDALKNKQQEDALISPFAKAENNISVNKFKLEHADDYFLIEPTYFVTSCNPFKNKKEETKSYVLLHGNYTVRDIVSKFNQAEDSYEYLVIDPDANNLINNFHLVENGYSYFGLGNVGRYFSNDVGATIGNYGASQWIELKNFLQNTKNGYGIAAMKVSAYFKPKEYCDYNNPKHFEANKEKYIETDDGGSGPDGANCCKYFEDEPNLYLDHPECYKPAKYKFDGATCKENENIATIKTDGSWGNVFASMFNEQRYGSSSLFVVKEDISKNKDYNQYTKLLCRENIDIFYPQPIIGNKTIGGHFIWPIQGSLQIQSNVKCKLFIDQISANYSSINLENDQFVESMKFAINEYLIDNYELDADFRLFYSDKEYGGLLNLIRIGDGKATSIGISGIDPISIEENWSFDDLKNVMFSFTTNVTYKLPETYRYQNLETGKYSNKITLYRGNDYKEGVLPISKSASLKEENNYAEIIVNQVGGFNKQIMIPTTIDSYKCDYELTTDPPGDGGNCYCLLGTCKQGTDLSGILVSENLTCPEAQDKYCDCDSPPVPDPKPTPCPEDSDCKDCYIDTVWQQYIREGKSNDEAKELAIKDVCYNGDDGGRKIVYRTISLDHPFPGKDGAIRFPGVNWNAKSNFENGDVKGVLLSRNDSVAGNALYDEEPMYVIELNPTIINNIRSYNNENDYDDFNLNCLQNNNGACVSSFLHGANVGTKDAVAATVTVTGSCATINTVDDFNKCEDTKE